MVGQVADEVPAGIELDGVSGGVEFKAGNLPCGRLTDPQPVSCTIFNFQQAVANGDVWVVDFIYRFDQFQYASLIKFAKHSR